MSRPTEAPLVVDSTELGREHLGSDVNRQFGRPGIDSQGPAGSRAPENLPPPSFEDEDPEEAALPCSQAEEAAVAAATHARRAGKGSQALLDEMEAAEQSFVQAHTPPPGRAPPPHPAAAAGVARPEARERVVTGLCRSLEGNAEFVASHGAGGAAAAAREAEGRLFEGSHSSAVYMSASANAVRMARSVADVAELIRIACGKPRAQEEVHDTTSSVVGLQGFVLKPDYYR